jgi:glycosyltransferase involved in cell wall biosynthesis
MKSVVWMPAYNAASTLEKTIKDIPKGFADEIILVDDSSKDDTVEIAKRLGLTVLIHDRNSGYGANQKTCYEEALKHNADIIIMIHPDYQYDGSCSSPCEIIEKDVCDVVGIPRQGHRMPGLRYAFTNISNRVLTMLENLITENLSEWHTGCACSRRY